MKSSAKPQAQSRQINEAFLRLLPAIARHAQFAFRDLKPEARSEAAQAVVTNALLGFRRLCEQGRQEIAYATSLARYEVLACILARAGSPCGRLAALGRHSVQAAVAAAVTLGRRAGWQEGVQLDGPSA